MSSNEPELPSNRRIRPGSIQANIPLPSLINKRNRELPESSSQASESSDTTTQSKRPRLKAVIPPLRPTNTFLFKSPNPFYSRHTLDDLSLANKMRIKCTQKDCNYEKIISRSLHGTNNYKVHYQK